MSTAGEPGDQQQHPGAAEYLGFSPGPSSLKTESHKKCLLFGGALQLFKISG